MESFVESRIREYLENLDPSTFSLSEQPVIGGIGKLGLGESNLSYSVVLNGKKYVLRINMDPSSPTKSSNEYLALKLVEPLQIAPMAYHYEPSRHYLGETFLIIGYIDGIPLDKIKIEPEITAKLGKMVARLHTTRVTSDLRQRLKKNQLKETLQETRERIDYIVNSRKEKLENVEFTNILATTYQELSQLQVDQLPPGQLVLGHGDIAPQNVILNEGKLALIDWEDLGLIDPALELAVIFDSFDFLEEQQEHFLKEYLKLRNDLSLIQRVRKIWPVQLFGVFCWAIMHAIEIQDKIMHDFFLQEQELKEHVIYAKKMLEKCRNAGLMNAVTWRNIERLFST